LIFQVLGTLLSGTSLIITLLLTLSVDHVGKFINFLENMPTIESFHLDNISKQGINLLMTHLFSVERDQYRSIFFVHFTTVPFGVNSMNPIPDQITPQTDFTQDNF